MTKYIALVYLLNLKHYRVFAIPEPIFLLEHMYPGVEDHNRQSFKIHSSALKEIELSW